MKGKPFGDLCVVVSKQEVDALNITPALTVLKPLLASPAAARAYLESVDIAFHEYNETSQELFEIPSVRNYVQRLDIEFPYWLFFLSKRTLGLQCLTYCFMLPFLKPEVRTEIHVKGLQDLLLKRWFPAMNQVAVFAGLNEEEIKGLTDRSMTYFTAGRTR